MFSNDNKYWDQFFSDDMSASTRDEGSGFRLKSPINAPLAQRRMAGNQSGFSGYDYQEQQRQQQQQQQQQHHQQRQPPCAQDLSGNGSQMGSARPVEHPGYYQEREWPENAKQQDPHQDEPAEVDVTNVETDDDDDKTVILDGQDFEDSSPSGAPSSNGMREKVYIQKPDMAFKDHNVEADGIGVFYDEDGNLVMEVGIDRVLRFTYRYGDDIEGYRNVSSVCGPPDHHVTISLQRWYKLLEVEEHIGAQAQEIFAGNGSETKLHLGGLYFLQISKRFSNVQIRQYSMPNSGQKLYATKFGISMSIPEYFYFSNLIHAFSNGIEKLKNLVPCYQKPHHSEMCMECFPLKKHGRRVEKRAAGPNGGGKQYMGFPEKRQNVDAVNHRPLKWPRLIKTSCVSASGTQRAGYFNKQ